MLVQVLALCLYNLCSFAANTKMFIPLLNAFADDICEDMIFFCVCAWLVKMICVMF